MVLVHNKDCKIYKDRVVHQSQEGRLRELRRVDTLRLETIK